MYYAVYVFIIIIMYVNTGVPLFYCGRKLSMKTVVEKEERLKTDNAVTVSTQTVVKQYRLTRFMYIEFKNDKGKRAILFRTIKVSLLEHSMVQLSASNLEKTVKIFVEIDGQTVRNLTTRI